MKITTLKSQVLGANFSQLKKLGLQTPFGQTAAVSNQPYSARSLEPSSQRYPADEKLRVGLDIIQVSCNTTLDVNVP